MEKTFFPPTNKQTNKSAFTLVEILLVITLIGLLASAVLPRISSVLQASVQSSVRRFSALVRYSYDQAILTGRVHRIVLDLDHQAWYLEIADVGLLPAEISKDSKEKDEKDKEESGGFKKVGKNLTGNMPNGVQIVEVESWRFGKKPISKGLVSLYTYPTGYVDEASIILAEKGKDKIKHFKITTESLTGKTKVLTELGTGTR